MLCNYVTGYLFAVIYIEVILKYMNKMYFNKYIALNFTCCILPLFIGGLSLIVSVACFTALFYRFTAVMDYTNQNEGVLGVVKSFLPSLFVTFFFHPYLLLASLGTKFLNALENVIVKKPLKMHPQKLLQAQQIVVRILTPWEVHHIVVVMELHLVYLLLNIPAEAMEQNRNV